MDTPEQIKRPTQQTETTDSVDTDFPDNDMYVELHRVAARLMASEHMGHTLQATALVNEAWLRMNRSSSVDCNGRQHFIALATNQMRCALIDHARRKKAAKRPSQGVRLSLKQYEDSNLNHRNSASTEMLDICVAIEKLEQCNHRHGQVFELRYLGGLSVRDCAAYLNVSERTIKSDWKFASAWIAQYLDLSAVETPP